MDYSYTSEVTGTEYTPEMSEVTASYILEQ